MDKDLFLSPIAGKSKDELNELLHAVFNIVMNGVEVLEVVSNEDNEIVDFKFLLINKIGTGYFGKKHLYGESLLGTDPGAKKSGLFNKLVGIVKNDEILDENFHYQIDGTDSWFHIKAQKYDHGVVLSREEITQKKLADDRISNLNRALTARNRELESLSSELKTFNKIAAKDYAESLRSLYTSLEFIVTQDAKNLSDAGKAHIRRGQSTIQKMKLLTEDVVAYSNIQSDGEPMSVKLDDILAATIHNLQEKIHVANATIHCDPLPEIIGHPTLLTLLFSHLVENGIKFRKDDTNHRVNIRYTRAEAGTVNHPDAHKDIAYYKVSVEDNGIGIEEEFRGKIFDIFFRLNRKTKNNGSGIGLAVCKKIMEIHDGFITAECDPECTTFQCFFPVI